MLASVSPPQYMKKQFDPFAILMIPLCGSQLVNCYRKKVPNNTSRGILFISWIKTRDALTAALIKNILLYRCFRCILSETNH